MNVIQFHISVSQSISQCLKRLGPRLVICTTVRTTAQQLSRHSKVFHSKSIVRQKSEGEIKLAKKASGPVADKKRDSGVAKAQTSAIKEQQRVIQTDHNSNEEELMAAIFGDSSNLASVNASVACIGRIAKSLLRKCVAKLNSKAIWIYIDALTYSQIISSVKDFGEPNVGYLIKCLKEAAQEDEVPTAPGERNT